MIEYLDLVAIQRPYEFDSGQLTELALLSLKQLALERNQSLTIEKTDVGLEVILGYLHANIVFHTDGIYMSLWGSYGYMGATGIYSFENLEWSDVIKYLDEAFDMLDKNGILANLSLL